MPEEVVFEEIISQPKEIENAKINQARQKYSTEFFVRKFAKENTLKTQAAIER